MIIINNAISKKIRYKEGNMIQNTYIQLDNNNA
jgi:hypothetical protein